MKNSFLYFVRNTLIKEHPGETAHWYATQYLELGHHLNDSKIPLKSLTSTLEQQVGMGREQSIRREKINGVYHYFPESSDVKTDMDQPDGIIHCRMELSKEHIRDITNLLTLDKFMNRTAAISWLVEEGIKANRDYLDKVNDVVEKTHEIDYMPR